MKTDVILLEKSNVLNVKKNIILERLYPEVPISYQAERIKIRGTKIY